MELGVPKLFYRGRDASAGVFVSLCLGGYKPKEEQ
jgi:hypothetical protein